MSRKPLLVSLVERGKPLAEVQVAVVDGQDLARVAPVLDALAPDIAAQVVPCHFQAGAPSHTAYEIRMDATREALDRLFGWRIRRVNLDRWNAETARYEGVWSDAFRWEELSAPCRYPPAVAGRIRAMGLTQPGASDNGKADELEYVIDD